MAFGDLIGALDGEGTSVTASNSATTLRLSNVVAAGDLIYFLWAQESTLSSITVSDTLGNVYTACNAGTDAGAITARAFYSVVTVPGTLTAVTASATPISVNWCAAAGMIKGPFSTIDKNPNNTLNDLSPPFNCPPTGVLGQANEVIMQWIVSDVIAAGYSETSPGFYVSNVGVSGGPVGRLGARVTTATTTVTPSFTSSVNPTVSIHGTTTFRKSPGQPTQAQLAGSAALSADASVFTPTFEHPLLAQFDGNGVLSINSLRRNWLVDPAASFAASSTLLGTLSQINAWQIGALFDGRGAIYNLLGQIKFIPTSAALAGSASLAARLAMPRSIAAALAASGAMSAVQPYSFTFWSGAAALAASGKLQVEVLGRSTWPLSAALAAAASMRPTALEQRLGAGSLLAASGFAKMAFVSELTKVAPFAAVGQLLGNIELNVGGTPPEVLLLWDRELEPDGSPVQQVIVSNWNSKLALEADYGLIGYSRIGRGPAERIRVIPPLFLVNQELSIDQGPSLLRLAPQAVNVEPSDIQQRLVWLEEYTTALAGSLAEALDRIELLEAKLNGQGKEPC